MPDFLKKILGGLAKEIPVVGDLVNDLLFKADEAMAGMPPEQRVAFETKMAEIGLEEFKTEINAKVDLMKTEIQSKDKFIGRARPTGLYIYYLVTVVAVVALVAGIELDTGALVTIVAPLAGFGGWYTHNRTKEKVNGKATT